MDMCNTLPFVDKGCQILGKKRVNSVTRIIRVNRVLLCVELSHILHDPAKTRLQSLHAGS